MKKEEKTQSEIALLRKYHAICRHYEVDKVAILESYGVESSTELSFEQLSEIIAKITKQEFNHEGDRWRKRLIAVISAWLRYQNKPETIEHVKAIACQSAGVEKGKFNSISIAKLRSIYNEWLNKNRVYSNVTNIVDYEQKKQAQLN